MGIDPWSQASLQQNERWLKAYVLSATGSPHDTDDIIQDVFRIAWEKRDSFAEGTNFGGWLREISRRVIARHFEGVKRKPCLFNNETVMNHLDNAAAASEDELLDDFRKTSRLTKLRNCISLLTERVRKIISLKYLKQLASEQIGAQLGMSVSAVNVATYKGRKELHECMQRNGD